VKLDVKDKLVKGINRRMNVFEDRLTANNRKKQTRKNQINQVDENLRNRFVET
jgi:hypothetical protein